MRESGILLNENNAKKIDGLCKSVQGRASVRCINYNIISDTARRVIAHYTCKIGLSKKALDGCTFYVDLFADKLPNSYKYDASAMSTVFSFKYHNGNVYITSVTRQQMGHNANRRVIASLTDTAKSALIESVSHMWI